MGKVLYDLNIPTCQLRNVKVPIPSSKLDSWANQGAIATSSAAYASIRHALLKASSPLAGRGVEIFLQGSYANSTNIYGDSDVDVVVLYADTFFWDMTALGPAERQLHEALFPPADYRWSQLRDDVLHALRSHYGNSAVTQGKKAIKVATGSGRRPSDVVPTVQYRRYATFVNRGDLSAHWGVQFFDSSGNPIVNYPKYHIARGEEKNQSSRTQGQYKPTVRVFKNFRNYLVERYLLGEDIAPSYSLECALYNVPDHLFIGPYTNTVPAMLDYLLNTPYAGFLCQNGVVRLIGTGSTQWSEGNFATFVVAARQAWDDWS
jgi:hypothetical protein